jgi:hypothetical protein
MVVKGLLGNYVMRGLGVLREIWGEIHALFFSAASFSAKASVDRPDKKGCLATLVLLVTGITALLAALAFVFWK